MKSQLWYIGTSGQKFYRRIRIGRFVQDKKISEVELYPGQLPWLIIKKVRS